jgi:pilus assembly protein CpaD
MLKRTLILAALVPATLAAGCTGTVNRGLEPVHQPVVTRTDYVFDVAAGPNGLSPTERIRLRGWMNGLKPGYGDRISIDDPSYAGNRAARREVADEASNYGLLLSPDVPVTGAPVAPGTVRIVLSRSSAVVPGCPDYTRMTGIEYEANTSSNYGCTVNANMAQMVADPLDLVRGRDGLSVADTATGGKAIGGYRAGSGGSAGASAGATKGN